MPGLTEAQKKLLSLRDLTVHQGVIHELQLVQLAYWFMALVPDLRVPPEFDYDAETKELTVRYPANLDMGEHFDKMFNLLQPSIKWLLGKDVTTCVTYAAPAATDAPKKTKKSVKETVKKVDKKVPTKKFKRGN
jgi:hypothetical protein